jgi:hypothetical protein
LFAEQRVYLLGGLLFLLLFYPYFDSFLIIENTALS